MTTAVELGGEESFPAGSGHVLPHHPCASATPSERFDTTAAWSDAMAMRTGRFLIG